MRRRVWMAAWLSLLFAGCRGDLLYFMTHTKIGISITGTGEQITEATFGYDRFEGTFIPVRDDHGHLVEEAPSVFACSAVDNRWFGGLSIEQTFATGEAAFQASEKARQLCDAVIDKQAAAARQEERHEEGRR